MTVDPADLRSRIQIADPLRALVVFGTDIPEQLHLGAIENTPAGRITGIARHGMTNKPSGVFWTSTHLGENRSAWTNVDFVDHDLPRQVLQVADDATVLRVRTYDDLLLLEEHAPVTAPIFDDPQLEEALGGMEIIRMFGPSFEPVNLLEEVDGIWMDPVDYQLGDWMRLNGWDVESIGWSHPKFTGMRQPEQP